MAVTTPLMLTIPQVAAAAQVSDDTVYREIAAGRLRAMRIRKVYRISRPALEEWLGLAAGSAALIAPAAPQEVAS